MVFSPNSTRRLSAADPAETERGPGPEQRVGIPVQARDQRPDEMRCNEMQRDGTAYKSHLRLAFPMGDSPEWVLAVNATSPRSLLQRWMHLSSSGTREWNSWLAGAAELNESSAENGDRSAIDTAPQWAAEESHEGCGEVVFLLRRMVVYIKATKLGAHGTVVVMLTQELCNENERHTAGSALQSRLMCWVVWIYHQIVHPAERRAAS
ncbi:hypothetical protein G7Z17_g3511 [Cylindrodendrum hubeiense]|uniref:Uncharacterized protein n=1 Tax=Cylindrodendrum hubeiense TaxID=595255 RepID=A0A9P5HFQ8_9HYPO|nr:hypothetical protein G7Z17_g3511 [Cylindrodendrum hubeiense]